MSMPANEGRIECWLGCFIIWSLPAFGVAKLKVPEGFEDVPTEELADVKLYYNNSLLGDFIIKYDTGYIEFQKPQKLADVLSMVTDKAPIIEALSGHINPHEDKVCHIKDKRKCPALYPKKASIIFDHENYSAELFIHPDYLKPAIPPKLQFLPHSKTPTAFANRFKTRIYGDTSSFGYDIDIDPSISKGTTSLVMKSLWSGRIRQNGLKSHAYKIHDLEMVHYDRRMVYQFGLLQSMGTVFTTSTQFFGIQVHTNKKLIRNRHVAFGTPLELNMRNRGYVDFIKDDEIIYSKYYYVGNHMVDTYKFPDGAYNITLNIRYDDGQIDSEQSFFVKNKELPPKGYPELTWSLGYLPSTTQYDGIMPKLSKTLMIHSKYKRRLGHATGVEVAELLFQDFQLFELSYTYSRNTWYVAPRFVVTNDAGHGYGLSMQKKISKSLRSILLIRSMDHKHRSNLSTAQHKRRYQNLNDIIRAGLYYSGEDWRATANINKQTSTSNLISETRSVTIGRRFNVSKRISLDTKLEMTRRRGDKWATLLTITAFDKKPRVSFRHRLIVRLANRSNLSKNTTHAIRYIASKHLTKNSILEGSIEKTQTNQNLSGAYTTNFTKDLRAQARLSFYDFKHQPNRFNYNIQLEHNKTFGIGYTQKQWGWAYLFPSNAGTMVRVKTKQKTSEFHVSVNQRLSTLMKGNQNHLFSLPPFKTYQLTVVSNDDKLFHFEYQNKPFTLYPYNINYLEINAKQYFVMISIFTRPNGEPIKNAIIKGGIHEAKTNAYGFSQVEFYPGAKLYLVDQNAQQCVLDTADLNYQETLIYHENTVCVPTTTAPAVSDDTTQKQSV